ncbi:Hydrogenase-1 operon protein HyaE [Hartmannibacter diazotrophicus]|uniref:Hydrogenase expression/formation protein n=1 Tax=Hartmannibacter diazotrophicus TaxID=1482074 RepID=A0A2C9D3A7_9HYPH|nr:hydrogenase [Hartmannibacter diazotrophicus]SON53955.1 Hydrogenase-1 operon protein HyaE [Hartmannibacter diazotrophicus]
MDSPLIERLVSELNYPLVNAENLDTLLSQQGERVLFLTGDPVKNLETNDLAVILPELARTFAGRLNPAVVDRSIEQSLRERFDVWPVPSLIFFKDGEKRGAIAKVRDWADYLAEIEAILDRPTPQAVH